MNQVLSQAEVDALLNAVADGSVETSGSGSAGKDSKSKDIQEYDLPIKTESFAGKCPPSI